MLEEIKKTAAFIRSATGDFAPEVGIVLGTGLGDFADRIETRHALDYKDIPGFPVSTVEGHKGRLIFGEAGGRRVVAMQGRFHYYEGYTMEQVTFPIRVMRLLGIRFLFVSNASGGINASFRTGDLMVITDHINLMPNPLIGPNMAELGPRFPDMHNCYDKALIGPHVRNAGRIPLFQGHRRRCRGHVHRAGGDRGASHVGSRLRRLGHHELRPVGRGGRPRGRAAPGPEGGREDADALFANDRKSGMILW